MTEIPCPVCGKPVASNAMQCPSCNTTYGGKGKTSGKTALKVTGIVVGIFVGLGVLGAMLPEPEKAKADDAEPSKLAAAPSEPQPVKIDHKPAVMQFGRALFAAMAPCDRSGKALASSAQTMSDGGSLYEVYGAAKDTEETCGSSSVNIRNVDVPDDLPKKAEEEAEKTVELCSTAAVYKQMARVTVRDLGHR